MRAGILAAFIGGVPRDGVVLGAALLARGKATLPYTLYLLLVVNGDLRIAAGRWNWKTVFLQDSDMVLHAPTGLI